MKSQKHMAYQRIAIEPLAPAKPSLDTPCNGCGVCCLSEPCPLGILLSGRRTGACTALNWDPRATRYHCGALISPQAVLLTRLPRAFRGLAPVLARWLARLAPRWIAAGTGCDCTLQVLPVPDVQSDRQSRT